MRASYFKRARFVFAAVFLLLLGGALAWWYCDDGRICGNVYIGRLPVGGMERGQAERLLSAFSRSSDDMLVIRAGDRLKSVPFAELALHLDIEKAIEQAFAVGRENDLIERLRSLAQCKKLGRYILLQWTWDADKASALAYELAAAAFCPPVSASFSIDKSGRVRISDSHNGLAVNVEESMREADPDAVALGIWDLKTETIPPAISSEDAAAWDINAMLASYTTRYNTKEVGRSENMRLAAAAINDCVLMPGEEFSFNGATGPRTAAVGYREAYVILNNKFERGLGGGVCQVSSTLYNAVLKAGLPVTERFAHSLPVSYVPKGMDATVSYGTLDLKFLNTTAAPVIIHSEIQNGVLRIALFGHSA